MLLPLLTRRIATGLSLALVVGAGLLSACKKDDETDPAATTAELRTAAVAQYAEVAYASYLDSRDAAVALRTKLAAFVAAPTATGLTEARTAYIAARTPYEQTEAFRFYGGPIDGTDGPEGLMNGWPMDENYVDYVVGNPTAGIINDAATYPSLSKTALEGLNEGGGNETNISTGYHAIEFLLWGQDLSATGPGARPYTDYVVGTGSTAANQARRGQYLLAITDLLIDDLNQVLAQWEPGQNNYRKNFTGTMPADSALTRIFNGLGQFTKGELYGERMLVAFNTRDQEDEHSCFSDQTHNDFILGQRSIDNVYFGRYTRTNGQTIDGVGLDEVVKDKSATADANLQTALTASKAAVAAINPPFDQEIVNTAGRTRVEAAIVAGGSAGTNIGNQAIRIVEAARAAGITIVL